MFVKQKRFLVVGIENEMKVEFGTLDKDCQNKFSGFLRQMRKVSTARLIKKGIPIFTKSPVSDEIEIHSAPVFHHAYRLKFFD